MFKEYKKSCFFKCECSCHALEINRFKEEFEKRTNTEFNFSIWGLGRSGEILNFRSRLRWCWKIICTGYPWADTVILTDKQADEICKFIQEELQK